MGVQQNSEEKSSSSKKSKDWNAAEYRRYVAEEDWYPETISISENDKIVAVENK